jgi:integrase
MAVSIRTWKTKSGEDRKAYVVRYRDGDRKYRLKTFKTRKEAKAWDARTNVDLEKGIHIPDSTSATISQGGELWLTQCEAEGVEPEVIAKYRQHLRWHIEPASPPEKIPNAWKGKFGDLKLSRLTGPVCAAFRLQVLSSNLRRKGGKIVPGRTVSRRTAQHVWNSFKQMLNVAVVHGLISYNPAHKMRLDTKNREKVLIQIGEQIPDRPDVRDILTASTGVWLVFFSTAAFSGLRSSELRGLGWPQVDLPKSEIQVLRRADWKGKMGPCKTAASRRKVQIPDHLVDLLRWWRQICPPSAEVCFSTAAGPHAKATSRY